MPPPTTVRHDHNKDRFIKSDGSCSWSARGPTVELHEQQADYISMKPANPREILFQLIKHRVWDSCRMGSHQCFVIVWSLVSGLFLWEELQPHNTRCMDHLWPSQASANRFTPTIKLGFVHACVHGGDFPIRTECIIIYWTIHAQWNPNRIHVFPLKGWQSFYHKHNTKKQKREKELCTLGAGFRGQACHAQ